MKRQKVREQQPSEGYDSRLGNGDHSALENDITVNLHSFGDEKPGVLILGPSPTAVSGIAVHVQLLISSDLQNIFQLAYFQAGGEGLDEKLLLRSDGTSVYMTQDIGRQF